jgi:hypothetical protein
MNAGTKKDTEMDDLLRKALADDLPADVTSGMRDRIERFRAATTTGEATAAGRAASRTADRAWLFPRTVWAALSILMLVAGILLQGARSRSALADRISEVKTQFASLETTRR